MVSIRIVLLITIAVLSLSSQAQSQDQPQPPKEIRVADFGPNLQCPQDVDDKYEACLETAKKTLHFDETVKANSTVEIRCSLHNKTINCVKAAMTSCASHIARVAQWLWEEDLKIKNAILYDCEAFEEAPPAADKTCEDIASSLNCLNITSYGVDGTVDSKNIKEKEKHCKNMNKTIDCFNALNDNCTKDVSQDRKAARVKITRTAYATFNCDAPVTSRSSGQGVPTQKPAENPSGKAPEHKMPKSAAESGMTKASGTNSTSALITSSGTTILALGSTLLFLRPLLSSFTGTE